MNKTSPWDYWEASSMRFAFRHVPFVLLLSATLCLAEDVALRPGEYLLQGGGGRLLLKSGGSGSFTFSISTEGGNGHQCDLDGEIRDGKAVLLEAMEKDKPCVVRFLPDRDGIDVQSNDRAICHYFCGARAGFEAFYYRPAKGCTEQEVAEARQAFKQLYGNKSFVQAKTKLEPILNNCTRTLDRWEEAWIRNDLAITHFKLGDLLACRQTLQPLAADASAPEDKVLEDYSPVASDIYRPILKATRTNLRLCRAKAS